jgi:NAD(P)-dependent dehydrogenase (short-subunit alcohol dehydrogenase family)
VTTQGSAVLTGAAGGLGVPLARALAVAGYELVLVDLAEGVNETAGLAAEGFTARAVVADLSDPEGLSAVVAAVAAAGSPLRLLVNNAGITRDARLVNMSAEAFDLVIDVNLISAMRLTYALGESFETGGAIVNMSSRAALGNFGQTNYVTSKSALVGFTRALAQAWAPRVRTNAVAPGLIDTPMTQAMPPEVLDKLVAKVPAGRIGTPEDIAAAVVFLASDAASYVNGQVLTVCGGRSISA